MLGASYLYERQKCIKYKEHRGLGDMFIIITTKMLQSGKMKENIIHIYI